MGYDPFEPSVPPSPDRLTVAVSRQGRGWAARVERYGPDGKRAWAETFRATGDDCGALISPLASGIRGWLIQGGPIAEPRPDQPAGHRLFGVDGNSSPPPPRPVSSGFGA